MKELWNTAQVIFAAIGGWLGYFLGGCDGLLIALVVFVAVDYVTGVMCAISDKKLSSEVGFKGICRKVLIFLLVGIANILDVQVIGTGSVLRTAVIFFYLSNEGVSLLENAADERQLAQLRALGAAVPGKLLQLLPGKPGAFQLVYRLGRHLAKGCAAPVAVVVVHVILQFLQRTAHQHRPPGIGQGLHRRAALYRKDMLGQTGEGIAFHHAGKGINQKA